MKRKRKINNIIIYTTLIILLFFWLFPLLMALINSFKSNRELLTNVMALPTTINLDNYLRTYEKMHYLRSFLNTLLLTSLGVGMMILFSAMAGWRLCRTKTKLSQIIFALFIFSMLIPFSSIMIPLYKVILAFHIKNSLIGLAFVYAGFGVSMAIFLYHGFIKGIPFELEEAAAIDGCSKIKIFYKIILPMLKPVTVAISISNVLWVWNDFLLPLISLSDNKKYSLLLSTNILFGQYSSDWSAILSALILSAIPVIIFYAIFQKQILKGIGEGAVKG
ncbi:MAG: sugar transporter permease [Herbinix sp.]|jgi:raffinose/stachyose/melibiose transport system permease protein|nr:sugar transporter permease [Herbinix sp.]